MAAGLEEPDTSTFGSTFGLPRDERARSFVYKSMIQSYVESAKNCELKLMVIGEAGQGKSTLINALVGQEVAKEGYDFEAGTRKVQKYTLNQNEVAISIWDTPGFGMEPEEDEAMLRQLSEEGCDSVDLALFCIRADTTRFPTNLHRITIDKFNKAFGWKFWKHCLFVLTFANNIQQFCPPDESMADFFSRRCLRFEERIKVALKEHAQLDSDVLDTVRAVPVGSHRKGLYRDNQWALPDREDWFIMFWIECTEHMQQSSLSALLRANYHRLESDVTQLQSSRPPPPRFIEVHDRLLLEEVSKVKLQMERDNENSKQLELTFNEAMVKGGGKLFQCNIVLYGPPGAGKTSIKRLILDQPPLPKHSQSSTDIMENCVRTVSVDRIAADKENRFMQVNNDDMAGRIAAEAVIYATKINVAETTESNMELVDSGSQQSQDKTGLSRQDGIMGQDDQNRTTAGQESTQDKEDRTEQSKQDCDVHSTPEPSNSITVEPTNSENTLKATPTEQLIKDLTFELFHNDSTVSSQHLFDCQWLHHIDSGGQPQFLAVFSLLFRNSHSHFIVVIKLTEKLDEKPEVQYYCNGENTYSLPDHLVLSNRDTIIQMCQLAQRISRATGGRFTPKVFVVGTRKDQLFPVFGWVHHKFIINRQLLRIYEKYSDVLVCKIPGQQVMFMMNAMAEGEERQKHTEELQKCILQATESVNNAAAIDVPLKWFIFHLELEKLGKGVIKKSDCLELGENLKMDENQVEAALIFLNKVALVLYYPEDVPDLVLTSVQPLINRLSTLIKASFTLMDREPTMESKQLKERGLFKKDFLTKVFKDIDDGLLSLDEFLAFLETLKIAVSVGDNEYFLPSALSLTPPLGKCSFKATSAPLALFWNELILPHGFFLTVSVELQRSRTGISTGRYTFQLCKNMPHWREEIYLTEKERKIPVVLKLADRHTWIEVSYSGPHEYCPKVFCVVNSATQRAVTRFKHMGLVSSPTIGNTCTLCNRNDHYSILSEDKKFMMCSENVTKRGPVKDHISCWFKDNSQQQVAMEPANEYPQCTEVVKSPLEIFNSHLPKLKDEVLLNADSFISDLCSAGIISSEADTTDGQSVTLHQKINHTLIAVRRRISESSEPEAVLVQFCAVLKNQNNDALYKLANEILSQLILSKRPDPNDVFELLKNKSAQWENIAIHFKVEANYRKGVRAESITPEIKLDSVLWKWVESECTDVTWCTVVNVLNALQYSDVLDVTKRFLRNEDSLRKYIK